jgi:hypothetical protein
MRTITTYQPLGEFKKSAIAKKYNYVGVIYAYIATVETMTGTTRQVKVGMTVSPYEMRCYKRPLSDELAFLSVEITSADITKLMKKENVGKGKKATKAVEKVEKACHGAMVENGFFQNSENFTKGGFTMQDVKTIIETTIAGL